LENSLREKEPIARIDFETRSRADLKKVGGYRYALDPSTEPLCLAYKLPDMTAPKLWHPFGDKERPFDLLEYVESGGVIEAHNAEFEFAVWNYVMRPKFKWPELKISQLRCSAAQAAILALPRSLEGLGDALELEVKKDMKGNAVLRKVSRPRKPTKHDKSEWHECIADYDRVFEYCTTDVLTEEAASEKMLPVSAKAQSLFELTVKFNNRGIYCDVDLCKIAVRFALRFQREVQGELKEITGGQITTGKQGARIIKFLEGEGLYLENLQAKTVEDALERKDISPLARRILEIRQLLGKASVSKFQTMLMCAGPDSRIRGTLMYHGASTGRYTGKNIQPQNFFKATIKDVDVALKALAEGDYEWFKCLYPNVMGALASCLRAMLRAAPGHELVQGDFNAIEARVIQWLAGDEENLKIYLTGGDPYKAMAALIYGVPESQVTKAQREVGKRAVLGCGFGMGGPKFAATCKQYALEVSKELALSAVEAYREKYHKVKSFWYELEDAALEATENPGKLVKLKHLQLLNHKGYLQIRLPSGRRISYKNPRVQMLMKPWRKVGPTLVYDAVHPKTTQWVREATYGGKLAENVTQAVAADIMTEAMFRLESSGYPVIMTVHDEIICEVPKGFGERIPHPEKAGLFRDPKMESIMAMSPGKWADGLPIKVEGWVAPRYRK
jgi:DNA polymerase